MLDTYTILPGVIYERTFTNSRPSYVYLGQMDACATYPSPFLDPCMAHIQTHVRIYLCNTICVYA